MEWWRAISGAENRLLTRAARYRLGSEGELVALAGDFPFFLRADHQHAHARIGCRDVFIQVRSRILSHVELQAQETEVAAHALSKAGGVLTHSSGKDNGIHAAEDGQHRAQFA